MSAESFSDEVQYEEHKRAIFDRLANFERILEVTHSRGSLVPVPTAYLILLWQLPGSYNLYDSLAVLFAFLLSVLGCVAFISNVMWTLDSSVARLRHEFSHIQRHRNRRAELGLLFRSLELLEAVNWRCLKLLLIIAASFVCVLCGYVCLAVTKARQGHHMVIMMIGIVLGFLGLALITCVFLSRARNDYLDNEIWCRNLKLELGIMRNLLPTHPMTEVQ